MDLLSLLNGLVAQLADAQAAADALAKLKFDEGFAAGVASVPASDKVFSQAEADAMVAAAVAPLQAQVSDLQQQVAAMQGQIDQKVADAIAAVKADLLAKVQALELSTQALEDLLK